MNSWSAMARTSGSSGALGKDVMEQKWQLDMGGVPWITICDINRDGRCEA